MTQLLDVFGLDVSDLYVRSVALALPAAVLLTLVVLLIMKSKKKKSKRGAAIEPPLSASPAADKVRDATAVVMPIAMPQQTPATPVASAAPAALLSQPGASVSVQPVSAAQLQTELNGKLASAPKATLAPLYLELARQCRASGDESACLAALRSAAGLAAQHGPRAAHAEARLELAEAAYAAGDLHGACEQWQMARTAFSEDGQKAAHARVEKLMRDHSCPTDWVLTDF